VPCNGDVFRGEKEPGEPAAHLAHRAASQPAESSSAGGTSLPAPRELPDLDTERLQAREQWNRDRIRPIRRTLQRRWDNLPVFVGILDG